MAEPPQVRCPDYGAISQVPTSPVKSAGRERTPTGLRDVRARPPVVLVRSNRVPIPCRILPGMTPVIALARPGRVRPTLPSARDADATSRCSEIDGAGHIALRTSAIVGREGDRG